MSEWDLVHPTLSLPGSLVLALFALGFSLCVCVCWGREGGKALFVFA